MKNSELENLIERQRKARLLEFELVWKAIENLEARVKQLEAYGRP